MIAASHSAQDPHITARRLIQTAHNRDGLPEITVGLLFLVSAALLYAQIILPRGSAFFKAACLTSSLLIPILYLPALRAMRWVRQRYLIDRVGYVQPKLMRPAQIAIGILVLAAITVALFTIVPALARPDRWVLTGSGVLAGAIAALSGRSLRFVVLGLLLACAGILVAFSGVPLTTGFAMLWGFAGVLSLTSGCVVFLRFVRRPVEAGA